MRILIVDDDKVDIKSLTDKLTTIPGIQIVGVAESGSEGLGMVERCRPDVMFLDVEMPQMSGLDFIDNMKRMEMDECKIVVYSSHPKYMLEAFRKDAVDFLTKPIDNAELDRVLARCREKILNDGASKMGSEIKNTFEEGKLILYTNTSDFQLVHIKDIGLFTYNHIRRVWEVAVAGRNVPVSLKRNVSRDEILQLDPHFVQVHQSYIININYLVEVIDNVCHFYPPFDNRLDVKVGRLYRHKLVKKFNRL